MTRLRHSIGRPRWYPHDRRYVTICTCGTRIDGETRPQAQTAADAHDALNDVPLRCEAQP